MNLSYFCQDPRLSLWIDFWRENAFIDCLDGCILDLTESWIVTACPLIRVTKCEALQWVYLRHLKWSRSPRSDAHGFPFMLDLLLLLHLFQFYLLKLFYLCESRLSSSSAHTWTEISRHLILFLCELLVEGAVRIDLFEVLIGHVGLVVDGCGASPEIVCRRPVRDHCRLMIAKCTLLASLKPYLELTLLLGTFRSRMQAFLFDSCIRMTRCSK